MENYSYPIDTQWTTSEIIAVMALYTAVETAYEKGIDVEELMVKYQVFKKIVNSKMQEKKLDQAFFEATQYSIYKTINAAKTTSNKRLVMAK